MEYKRNVFHKPIQDKIRLKKKLVILSLEDKVYVQFKMEYKILYLNKLDKVIDILRIKIQNKILLNKKLNKINIIKQVKLKFLKKIFL